MQALGNKETKGDQFADLINNKCSNYMMANRAPHPDNITKFVMAGRCDLLPTPNNIATWTEQENRSADAENENAHKSHWDTSWMTAASTQDSLDDKREGRGMTSWSNYWKPYIQKVASQDLTDCIDCCSDPLVQLDVLLLRRSWIPLNIPLMICKDPCGARCVKQWASSIITIINNDVYDCSWKPPLF